MYENQLDMVDGKDSPHLNDKAREMFDEQMRNPRMNVFQSSGPRKERAYPSEALVSALPSWFRVNCFRRSSYFAAICFVSCNIHCTNTQSRYILPLHLVPLDLFRRHCPSTSSVSCHPRSRNSSSVIIHLWLWIL